MTEQAAETDQRPMCALLLPRKRGEYAECRHTEVTRAGGECKFGHIEAGGQS